MSDADQRAGYIAGLRALAVLLEQHPELELPYTGSTRGIQVIPIPERRENQREQLAAWARVLPDRSEDLDSPTDLFVLRGSILGLRVDVLCNRASVEGVEWQHPISDWRPRRPIPGDVWIDNDGAPWFAVSTAGFPCVALVATNGDRWDVDDEVWNHGGPMRLAHPAGGAR